MPNPLWDQDTRQRVYVTITPDNARTKVLIDVYAGVGATALVECERWVSRQEEHEDIVRSISKVVEDLCWVALTELELQGTLMDAEETPDASQSGSIDD